MATLPVYPKSNIALLDARLVAAAWVALAILAVSLLLILVGSSLGWPLFKASFPMFAFFAAAHLVASLRHRCPVCLKRPTMQGFAPVHPQSKSQSSLEGWAGAVVNVLRRGRLVCIHCGTEFSVEP
jgi:hypothetical protein